MIRCRECGTVNEDSAEFCGGCGQFLEWTGEPVAADDPVTAPPAQPEADPAPEVIPEPEALPEPEGGAGAPGPSASGPATSGPWPSDAASTGPAAVVERPDPGPVIEFPLPAPVEAPSPLLPPEPEPSPPDRSPTPPGPESPPLPPAPEPIPSPPAPEPAPLPSEPEPGPLPPAPEPSPAPEPLPPIVPEPEPAVVPEPDVTTDSAAPVDDRETEPTPVDDRETEPTPTEPEMATEPESTRSAVTLLAPDGADPSMPPAAVEVEPAPPSAPDVTVPPAPQSPDDEAAEKLAARGPTAEAPEREPPPPPRRRGGPSRPITMTIDDGPQPPERAQPAAAGSAGVAPAVSAGVAPAGSAGVAPGDASASRPGPTILQPSARVVSSAGASSAGASPAGPPPPAPLASAEASTPVVSQPEPSPPQPSQQPAARTPAEMLAAAAAAQSTPVQPRAPSDEPLLRQPTAVTQAPPRAAQPVRKLEERIARPGDLICSNCNEPNDPVRRFCRRCGTSLAVAVAPPARRPWWRRIFGKATRAPSGTVASGAAGTAVTAPALRSTKRASAPGLDVGALVKGGLGLLVALGLIGAIAFPDLRSRIVNDATGLIDDVRRLLAPTIEPVHPIAAAASSETEGHPAGLLIDQKTNSDWQSAEATPTVTVTFQSEVDLAQIYVSNGVAGDYLSTRRPTRLAFLVPGGAAAEIQLADDHEPQRFDLRANDVRTLEIRVLETTGAADAPVALSEIEFFLRR